MISEIAGAGSANVIAGANGPRNGLALADRNLALSQQSREEKAGPDAGPGAMLRQQLALLSLQQQAAESCEANASAGMGWARRTNANTPTRNRTARVGIRPVYCGMACR
jgi:hypothetical protein